MRHFRFWLKAAASLLVCAQASGAIAQKAIDLPGERFFPENVTSDGKGTAYVPSAQGGVYKVALATGKVTPWIAPGAYGSASILGVLVDPARKLLWTCNNDLAAVGLSVAGRGTRAPRSRPSISRPARARSACSFPAPMPIATT